MGICDNSNGALWLWLSNKICMFSYMIIGHYLKYKKGSITGKKTFGGYIIYLHSQLSNLNWVYRCPANPPCWLFVQWVLFSKELFTDRHVPCIKQTGSFQNFKENIFLNHEAEKESGTTLNRYLRNRNVSNFSCSCHKQLTKYVSGFMSPCYLSISIYICREWRNHWMIECSIELGSEAIDNKRSCLDNLTKNLTTRWPGNWSLNSFSATKSYCTVWFVRNLIAIFLTLEHWQWVPQKLIGGDTVFRCHRFACGTLCQ